MKRWRITHLHHSQFPGVREWVFEGGEFDLNKYLQLNHSCSCTSCKDLNWWETAQACEYSVEEITGCEGE